MIPIADQSGSMIADFGGGDRWNVLRDSFLDETGLIRTLEDRVEFGLALYSALSDDEGRPLDPDMCPPITWLPPAPSNYDAIASVYSAADPLDDTPTGDAIWDVLDRYRSVPDPDPDPTIFIVATDGEPDRCEELDPSNGQAESIAAVEDAYDAGIRPDGRRVVDEDTIEFRGAACDELQGEAGATLEATFPCDVVLI